MSTENEGTAGDGAERPPARSVPPVPDAAPEGTPGAAYPPPAQPPSAAQGSYGTPAGPATVADAAPGTPPPPQGPPPGYDPHAPTAVHATAGGTPGAPENPPTPTAADAGWPPPPPAYPAYGGGGGNGDPGSVWGAPDPSAPRKRRGGLIAAVIIGALVAGGIGGGVGYWAADQGSTGSTTVTAASPALQRAPGSVAGVAQRSLPSVVTLEAQDGNGGGDTGTGFVYDKQGHILTNNHVVASAAEGGQLTATFSNGKKYEAEVVGRAQGYDVAVLKLKNAPSGLTPLPLGNSDKVAVGDATIAIGAPFGLSNTVTTGIISAKNRPVVSGDGGNSADSYMSALQTDASINPGNSGGPLMTANGAVVGINSAIQPTGNSSDGQSEPGSVGLGFAIPINQASTVAQQLIKTGQPVYPVIGATVSLDGGQPGDGTGDGATIPAQGVNGTQAVTPGGPAAKAGLKPGDVITKFDGAAIDSGPTLISEIWTHKPGDKVSLTYQRDGKSTTVDVTLGSRKGDSAS